MNDNDLLQDISTNTINKISRMRRKGITYKEILEKIDISEDKLKIVCNHLELNNSNLNRSPSQNDIINMQKYYNECESYRKVAKNFNVSRATVIKYVKIKKKIKLDENTRKINKSQAVIDWRRRTKIKLVEYKGGKCEICGYSKTYAALSFHHKDPNEKDFGISSKSYSFERMKKEVDKCIMVCNNCHTEIHEEIKCGD
ncbi:hypothetical protein HGB07_07940 [Candidatus Roizmanbacteria bacterium]|nr:hypothetical protein [Candidatus Roizmanbacteria bacterium]